MKISHESPISADALMGDLVQLANPRFASDLLWFFKTGPGEYGEGDQFLGIKVPVIRQAIKPYRELAADQLEQLIKSPFHEHRFAALVILVAQFERAKDPDIQQSLFELYLHFVDLGRVNNWDLVDVSASKLGAYLIGKPFANDLLLELAKSKKLWHQRVAVVLTFPLIRQYELDQTFMLANLLVDHEHDLINKAVGWMLREAGLRDGRRLRGFLEEHAATMPRTCLRYSIEKFSEKERKDWLSRSAR